MAVSWVAVAALATTVLGATIVSEKQVLEKAACGRVWVTVHSPEIKRSEAPNLVDALELNWDFNGCLRIPMQIGLFDDRPASWNNALSVHPVDTEEGYVVTNISLGEPSLPGWETGPGPKGPHCLWPWVGAGDEAIEAYNCLKIQPTWMEDNADKINQLPLGELVLPGTHNAGAWRFNTELSTLSKDTFVLCQDRSIWAQLVHGIRYFDFRIAYYDFYETEDDRYWLNHNLIRVRPLVPLLREIRAFLDHTKEVVLLDAHHFPMGFYNPDGTPIRSVHQGLLNIIQRELGSHIAPAKDYNLSGWTKGPSVQSLLDSNKRLLFSYVENAIVSQLKQWIVFEITLLMFLTSTDGAFRNLETLKTPINVGAILPPNTVTEVAFASALARASMESEKYHFIMKVVYAPQGDSFAASKAACELIAGGVVAVFGPTDAVSVLAAEAQCKAVKIPHIQAVWRPPPYRGTERASPPGINLYPEAVALSKAIAMFIKDSDWNSYTLLYDDEHGLIRLQEILKHADPEHKWIVKRLIPGEDNRPLLKALKALGETRVILDCPADRVMDYLRQANEVKFFEDYMSYILMSLDAHTLDLEELRYGLSNVTCLRIFDHEDSRTRSYLADWRVRGYADVNIPKQTYEITVEAALASDAARLITDAVESAPDEFKIETQPIECGSETQWEIGEDFINHILTNPIIGMTDNIQLDNTTGERTNFNVEILELSNSGFTNIAKWNADTGFVYVRSPNEVSDLLAEKWQNKTFRVVSRIGAPYLVERVPPEGEEYTGNDRFEGYSKDLIHEVLKETLHLNYEIEIVPGNGYGSYNKDTKKWDGLVGHLIERKAELAICDLTITYERRSAVDFTTPFMTLGISILYSKPSEPEPELFSFLKPFSVDVWIYMAAAYLMVSLLLHVLARLAPNDWENPHPCDKSPEELENIWHIRNSCWLTMGSIMTQGSDILPKGYSTRWVCGMWWFFALIMCSSYTANLAAFLTNAAMDDSIKSAEDLAMQTKIKYGTVYGGSTFSFFKRSNVSIYQRMWAAMESARPSVFMKNNDEGVERVMKSKRTYAFLMESTAIEYQLERHCDLMQVGGLLDSKGYGIALPFFASYRTAVDNAVLKLAESGKLVELKNRWWKAEDEGCISEEAGEEGASAAELGVSNVGGVFVVLGIGCGLSAAMGTFEFLWHVREVAVEQKMTQSEAFWAELTFALSFWETEKPVAHDQSSSSASESNNASRASSVLRSAADLFRLNVGVFK